MTLQNSSVQFESPWHLVRGVRASVNPLNHRWVFTLECSTPVSAEDLDDLEMIRQGIVGLGAVRLSKNKREVFIEFVDPSVDQPQMMALAEELFRQAQQHTNTLVRYQSPPVTFVPAMAVHSDVGRPDNDDTILESERS